MCPSTFVFSFPSWCIYYKMNKCFFWVCPSWVSSAPLWILHWKSEGERRGAQCAGAVERKCRMKKNKRVALRQMVRNASGDEDQGEQEVKDWRKNLSQSWMPYISHACFCGQKSRGGRKGQDYATYAPVPRNSLWVETRCYSKPGVD